MSDECGRPMFFLTSNYRDDPVPEGSLYDDEDPDPCTIALPPQTPCVVCGGATLHAWVPDIGATIWCCAAHKPADIARATGRREAEFYGSLLIGP